MLLISVWLDTGSLTVQSGLTRIISSEGPWIVRSLVAFATLFLALGYFRTRHLIKTDTLVDARPSWKFLSGHLGALGVFGLLSNILFGLGISGFRADALVAGWLAAGLIAVALGCFAFVPPAVWLKLGRASGNAWIYASISGVAAFLARGVTWSLWSSANQVTLWTFHVVKALLTPFLSGIIADTGTMNIGSQRFHVQIAPECSGYEGVGLILIFGVAWLWFFRSEFRFPRALILPPAGVLLIWLANAARIAALILIGNAGAPGVALGGFHSQAGWIAFNAVAIGMALAARNSAWLTVRGVQPDVLDEPSENPVAPYLMPFLMIMAAAMISRAVADGFEWLYPLRFLAAATTLWFFRARYRELDWRFGWVSIATGAVVFVLWLALDKAGGEHAGESIGTALQSSPDFVRFGWLAIRTLAAVVTVPIAEELAFRGFLLRRLISLDFEAVAWRNYSALALIVSSVAFGSLHGERWLAGSLAGLLYAGAMLWRGRIGDAVVAHATTNALLAAWVLLGQRWSLW